MHLLDHFANLLFSLSKYLLQLVFLELTLRISGIIENELNFFRLDSHKVYNLLLFNVCQGALRLYCFNDLLGYLVHFCDLLHDCSFESLDLFACGHFLLKVSTQIVKLPLEVRIL